jgi:hypothetical protein
MSGGFTVCAEIGGSVGGRPRQSECRWVASRSGVVRQYRGMRTVPI